MKDNNELNSDWYVCSDKCLESFVLKVKEQITPEDIPISESRAISKIPLLVKQTITNPTNKTWHDYFSRKSKWKEFYVDFTPPLGVDYPVGVGNPFFGRLSGFVRLIVVEHLMTAGRFEDTAKLYERMEMYEEAGKVRAKGSEIRIKKTEVSVDLNSLLGQLKEGGIVVVYRCPHCGGKVKVSKDTSIESLKQCEHCGSKIETMDLAEFLKTALS